MHLPRPRLLLVLLAASGVARKHQVFDVKHYGATGDGITDDGAAVEAALAAASLAAAGGSAVTVLLTGPAVYVVERELVLNASNCQLRIEPSAGACLCVGALGRHFARHVSMHGTRRALLLISHIHTHTLSLSLSLSGATHKRARRKAKST